MNAVLGNINSFYVFTPQPLRAPGYCRRPSERVGGWAGERQGRQAPLILSRPEFFTDHFQTSQGHLLPYLLPYDLGRVRSWRFCLIKYAHNAPLNEPASFGILGLIFQAKVTKFGTKVGLKMLININSGFFHSRQKKNWQFFFAFCNFAHGKLPLALSRP